MYLILKRQGKSVKYMLTLQSSKSRSVCLLMFEVKQDSIGDVILLTSQGVSFTVVQEGLTQSCFPKISWKRRKGKFSALCHSTWTSNIM